MGNGIVILDRIPDGWRFIKNATTAPDGYCFVCNGKSRFTEKDEYRNALVKVTTS